MGRIFNPLFPRIGDSRQTLGPLWAKKLRNGFSVTVVEIIQDDSCFLVLTVALVGLMMGSFLNVVVYRLPIMMEKSWRIECLDYLQMTKASDLSTEPFNLSYPGSHCPHCGTRIHPLKNIPILSYTVLRGRCSDCNKTISVRYPLVEFFTAITSAAVAWKFGFSVETVMALILSWSLISLSLIDFDHQLLPDTITLPLLWLGLFASLFDIFIDSRSSIIGGIAGYLSLWSVYKLFKLITGKEGMGYGDFKLLAMLGTWMGWQKLPLIILMSSFVGAFIGVFLILIGRQERSKPIPFGPYLAVAGWVMLLFGDSILGAYLSMAF